MRVANSWAEGRWAFEVRGDDDGSALYACYEPVATAASTEVAS